VFFSFFFFFDVQNIYSFQLKKNTLVHNRFDQGKKANNKHHVMLQ